jgi:signal peptidase I
MENFEEIEKEPIIDSSNDVNNDTQTPEEISLSTPKKTTCKTNSAIFNFLYVFGAIMLLFFFFYGVYFKPIGVIGTSMQPTINAKVVSETDDSNNDVVLYKKAGSYNRGDIVIVSNEKEQYFKHTETQKVYFMIKRVIAIEGDTITFHYSETKDNKIYYVISIKDSSGKSVELNEETYTKEPMYFTKSLMYKGYFQPIAITLSNDSIPAEDRSYSITISEDKYFIMGDNRNNSDDSRVFGQVAYEDICGSVRVIIKNGESFWIALFKSFKESLLGSYKLNIKEYL